MSREHTNIPESVRQRLRNKSRQMGVSPDTFLQFYAMERFLYRLGLSRYRNDFVLKGAVLLLAWQIEHMRPTRDIDLLGFTDNSLENIARIFSDICEMVMPDDDGLVFDAQTLHTVRIKEDADYEGVRATFLAYLGATRIRMQIDVGFNDIISPAPQAVDFPVLLNNPPPELRGYTAESVVAEKFEAMVKLGEINSRLKDFFDIWLLSQQFTFRGSELSEAIRATFERRGTLLDGLPATLGTNFAGHREKQIQWSAFLQKSKLDYAPPQFADVAACIAAFIAPIINARSEKTNLNTVWQPSGPWGTET